MNAENELFDTEKALNQTKMLLGITDDNSKNKLLSFLIDDSIFLVLSYCKIKVLPEALYYLIPQIAADRYRMQSCGSETVKRRVKSYTQGLRSEEYESSDIYSEHFLNNYKNRLAPFMSKRGYVPSDISSDAEHDR